MIKSVYSCFLKCISSFSVTKAGCNSRCKHIRKFSTEVFHFLSDTFSYKLGFAELGMTDHLVKSIAEYARYTGDSSVEIYKLPPNIEAIYGNDLDLFVQTKSGQYVWYALQAKIMSYNGAYKDLINKSSSKNQWDKLLDHEKKFGSISYYLFYSGSPPTRSVTGLVKRNDCIGTPDIAELGLGIVKTKTVKNIRENILKPYGLFYFRNVFPDDIDSLRKLICCEDHISSDTKFFVKEDIRTDIYTKVSIQEKIDYIDDDNKNINDEMASGMAPTRIILSKKTNMDKYFDFCAEGH